MQLGIQLPEVERVVRWPEYRAMAIAAERVGLDSLWVGDHFLMTSSDGSSVGPWEAWSLLAGLAEVTQKVRLGPLVTATTFRNPALLVKIASTVDEISGGRLILGLGAGWNRREYQAFGFPYDRRVARFEEALRIISNLIREGSYDFVGKFYTVNELEITPRPRSSMPLMVGSVGPKMLRLSIPYVDVWNAWYSWFSNSVSEFATLMKSVDAACTEVARDPASLLRSAAVFVQLERGTGRFSPYDPDSDIGPIVGSADAIAEQLMEFGAAGADSVQIVLDPIDEQAIYDFAPVVKLVKSR